MVDYFFEVKEHTLALLDETTNKYIKLGVINGSDGSGYLILNSSNRANPDYAKITYHPKVNELLYEFTNEFWATQNKPNQERKKFIAKPTHPNQTLALIYIDRSALFRTDEIERACTKIIFPDEGVVEVELTFEDSRLTVKFQKISEEPNIQELIKKSVAQVYENIPQLRGPANGCVQALLTGEHLPLRLVLFGV